MRHAYPQAHPSLRRHSLLRLAVAAGLSDRAGDAGDRPEDGHGQATRTLASGRTDAGVHALGQVVGLRTESTLGLEVLRRALNANLPDDVAVLEAAEAPEGFHPIRDARWKRYRYVIHNGPIRDVFSRRYAWHLPAPLDAEAMQAAAACLLGTHDFASFQTAGAPRQSTVRTVSQAIVRCERDDGAGQGGPAGQRIAFEIQADGFLYNMVRTIVGTLVEVGRGARRPAWVAEVLQAVDRRRAGPTAPPEGLFLLCVEYGEEEAGN